nr:unnamed protein product [Digitaria exilis]
MQLMEASNKKKRSVAIIGAGASGLAACKHAKARGFRPVVFEAGDGVGGVWRHTLASTRLQTPAQAYRFSDFPWRIAGGGEFPRHDKVAEYLAAYARRFGVLECVKLGAKVLAVEYVGVAEEEVAAWERWSGNGEAFGDGRGEWLLTVQRRGSDATLTYKFDFLILCIGKYGTPNIPTFPLNEGPEVFNGKVLHSMEYSRMHQADAAKLIQDKRVVVVGSGKSAFDTVTYCADTNGYPCTMIYRSTHWMVDAGPVYGVKLGSLCATRFAELSVHKPGEGLLLSLLATMLIPLRWLVSKLVEAWFKTRIPMKKHGMVPSYSFSRSIMACRLGILPDGFYDRVDRGKIVLKPCKSFRFCEDGVLLVDGGGCERVDADVVILATGYQADPHLSGLFFSPWFSKIVARQCIHPRIPQMAVIGYTESTANIHAYEMMAKWVAHLLDGEVCLPGVAEMEHSVAEWDRWGRRSTRARGSSVYSRKSCIGMVTTWYNDQLCRDMGRDPRRKKGALLAEWLQPYGPIDYADIQ